MTDQQPDQQPNPTERNDAENDEAQKQLREFGYYFPLTLVVAMKGLGTTNKARLFDAVTDLFFLGKMPDKPLPKQAQMVFDAFMGRIAKAHGNSQQKDATSYEELLERERTKALKRSEYARQKSLEKEPPDET